jgi:uncharacterized protein YkwD
MSLLERLLERLPGWLRHKSGPPPTPPPVLPTSPGPSGTSLEERRARLLFLHNQQRPLTASLHRQATLDLLAQTHAAAMAQAQSLKHELGGDIEARLRMGGYPYRQCGENIASSYSTPELVMSGWMNSPDHRANILDTDYEEVGLGVTEVNGQCWWCVILATPGVSTQHQPARVHCPPGLTTEEDS